MSKTADADDGPDITDETTPTTGSLLIDFDAWMAASWATRDTVDRLTE